MQVCNTTQHDPICKLQWFGKNKEIFVWFAKTTRIYINKAHDDDTHRPLYILIIYWIKKVTIRNKKNGACRFDQHKGTWPYATICYSQFREQALAEAIRLHEQNMKHPQSSPEVDGYLALWLNVLKISQYQGHVLEARLNFLGWVKIKRSYVVNPGESLEVSFIIWIDQHDQHDKHHQKKNSDVTGAVLSAWIRGGGVEKCTQYVGLPLQTWMVCNHTDDGDEDSDDDDDDDDDVVFRCEVCRDKSTHQCFPQPHKDWGWSVQKSKKQ